MAAFTAFGLHAQGAEGQSQVITYDEQALKVNVLLVHPIAHGITAGVHVSGGLEKNEVLVFYLQFGNKTIPLVFKANIGRLSEGVQYFKAYVMSGILVFVTDVTQTNNQEIHPMLRLIKT